MRRPKDPSRWTEASVTRAVVHRLFNRAVLAVPCCGWTGHEADILVVTKNLRLIDVEVKISRADLRADAKKDKWWLPRPWSRRAAPLVGRGWPPKVWKHYYAMPAEIWSPDLLDGLPAASGVLLLRAGGVVPTVARQARPNRDAAPISAADAIDIARLAGLRMWDALVALDQERSTQTKETI